MLIHDNLLKKIILTNLKSKIYKLDNDKLAKLDAEKLKPVPTDLSKLSNVVKNNFVKQDAYDGKIKDIEDKVPILANVATNTALNAKISEAKNKIHCIPTLVTTDVTDLVKKPDCNTKISEMEQKYLLLNKNTTSGCKKFTNNILDTKIKEKKLVNESNISGLVKIKKKTKAKALDMLLIGNQKVCLNLNFYNDIVLSYLTYFS